MRWPWRPRPKAPPLTYEAALGLLRCGFGLADLEAWLRAPEALRRVFVAAAERLDAERTATAGLAAQSPLLAAEVYRTVDGGAQARKIVMLAAARRAARRAGQEVSP